MCEDDRENIMFSKKNKFRNSVPREWFWQTCQKFLAKIKVTVAQNCTDLGKLVKFQETDFASKSFPETQTAELTTP